MVRKKIASGRARSMELQVHDVARIGLGGVAAGTSAGSRPATGGGTGPSPRLSPLGRSGPPITGSSEWDGDGRVAHGVRHQASGVTSEKLQPGSISWVLSTNSSEPHPGEQVRRHVCENRFSGQVVRSAQPVRVTERATPAWFCKLWRRSGTGFPFPGGSRSITARDHRSWNRFWSSRISLSGGNEAL